MTISFSLYHNRFWRKDWKKAMVLCHKDGLRIEIACLSNMDGSELDFGRTNVRGFVAGDELFGRYTLKNILGRGGMGVVWLARDDSVVLEPCPRHSRRPS